MRSFSEGWFLIPWARLGLTGAKAQVSVGCKEMHAVVERSPCIGIQNAFDLDKTVGHFHIKGHDL
jgi:hypothetical protein